MAAGTNGDRSPYRAIVVIAEHEDAFRLQWIFPSRKAVVGLGILGGDMLAVSYFGSPPGIVLYQVEGDRLVGRWTMLGGGGHVATETLTPVREHPLSLPSAQPQRSPGLAAVTHR